MKRLPLLAGLLLTAGCVPQHSSGTAMQSSGRDDRVEPALYTVLSAPPDSALDEIGATLSTDGLDFERQLWERFASSAIHGQRAVSMLELACYADVQCHPVEYPLRIATIDFVREHLDSPGVRDAVIWIRESYESRLPLDAPDDDDGVFRGLLVQAMKVRMTEYANELLGPEDSGRQTP